MVLKNEHAERSLCPIACGLDVIGDHWTLILIRDLLLFGKHEFREFLESEEGISSNILSDRLQRLQKCGLIKFIYHPNNRRRKLYYLTPQGKDLAPVLAAIFIWYAKHAQHQADIHQYLSERKLFTSNDFIQYTQTLSSGWEQSYGIEDNH